MTSFEASPIRAEPAGPTTSRGTDAENTTPPSSMEKSSAKEHSSSAASTSSGGGGGSGTSVRVLYCRRCEGHGRQVILKGHAPVCPFETCTCPTCEKLLSKRMRAFEKRNGGILASALQARLLNCDDHSNQSGPMTSPADKDQKTAMKAMTVVSYDIWKAKCAAEKREREKARAAAAAAAAAAAVTSSAAAAPSSTPASSSTESSACSSAASSFSSSSLCLSRKRSSPGAAPQQLQQHYHHHHHHNHAGSPACSAGSSTCASPSEGGGSEKRTKYITLPTIPPMRVLVDEATNRVLSADGCCSATGASAATLRGRAQSCSFPHAASAAAASAAAAGSASASSLASANGAMSAPARSPVSPSMLGAAGALQRAPGPIAVDLTPFAPISTTASMEQNSLSAALSAMPSSLLLQQSLMLEQQRMALGLPVSGLLPPPPTIQAALLGAQQQLLLPKPTPLPTTVVVQPQQQPTLADQIQAIQAEIVRISEQLAAQQQAQAQAAAAVSSFTTPTSIFAAAASGLMAPAPMKEPPSALPADFLSTLLAFKYPLLPQHIPQ